MSYHQTTLLKGKALFPVHLVNLTMSGCVHANVMASFITEAMVIICCTTDPYGLQVSALQERILQRNMLFWLSKTSNTTHSKDSVDCINSIAIIYTY